MYRTLTVLSATRKRQRGDPRLALLPSEAEEPPDAKGATHRTPPSRERRRGRIRIDRGGIHEVMLGPVLADGGAAGGDDVAVPVSAFAERHRDREATWDAHSHDGCRVSAPGAPTSVAEQDVQRDVPLARDSRREAVQNRCEETEDPSRERPLGFRCARCVCCSRHRVDLPYGVGCACRTIQSS